MSKANTNNSCSETKVPTAGELVVQIHPKTGRLIDPRVVALGLWTRHLAQHPALSEAGLLAIRLPAREVAVMSTRRRACPRTGDGPGRGASVAGPERACVRLA